MKIKFNRKLMNEAGRSLCANTEISFNKFAFPAPKAWTTRSYRYLSGGVAVSPRSEEHYPPPPLHLGHHLAVAEAEQSRDTKALVVNGKIKNKIFIFHCSKLLLRNKNSKLTWNEAVNAEITEKWNIKSFAHLNLCGTRFMAFSYLLSYVASIGWFLSGRNGVKMYCNPSNGTSSSVALKLCK